MGRGRDRRDTGCVPGALGVHVAKARATTGVISRAWLRTGRCHDVLAIGAQREPDWAEAKEEGGRARKKAKEAGEVAECELGGGVTEPCGGPPGSRCLRGGSKDGPNRGS
jgi:hypothetical protein